MLLMTDRWRTSREADVKAAGKRASTKDFKALRPKRLVMNLKTPIMTPKKKMRHEEDRTHRFRNLKRPQGNVKWV